MKSSINLNKRIGLCFRPNDIRCIFGTKDDGEIAYRTGQAIVKALKCKDFILGHDMRNSSHILRDKFTKGVTEQGSNVIDIGMVSTPVLYFASFFLKLPGAMITASHNPSEYNGIKMVKSGAIPIGEKTGLSKIKALAIKNKFQKGKKGKRIKKDILKEYKSHVLSFINKKFLKPYKIVIDAGNGMAGKMIPIVYKNLPVKIIGLEFTPKGTFPHHIPNPIIYKNVKDLQAKVKKTKADFGAAFDSDMDRILFIDEKGKIIDPSITAALIIKHIAKNSNVVYNTAISKIVPETTKLYGGKPFKEKVGHSYIKARMRSLNAMFGCEHSAHYYYKKNHFADSAIITSLLVLEIFSKSKGKFSELTKEFQKYHKIQEASLKVKDKSSVLKKTLQHYKSKAKKVEKIDGLTVEFENYWFNIRPSNTEPLLRINLEANDKKTMLLKKKELISFIKSSL